MFRRLLIRRQFPTLIIITVSYNIKRFPSYNLISYIIITPVTGFSYDSALYSALSTPLGNISASRPFTGGQMLIQPHCRSHFTGYLFITWVERSDTDKMPCSMTYQVRYRGSNPRPLHYQSSGKTIAFNYDIESLTLTLTLKSYIEHNLNYCPILDYLISV